MAITGDEPLAFFVFSYEKPPRHALPGGLNTGRIAHQRL
jgi:hypothetical protein